MTDFAHLHPSSMQMRKHCAGFGKAASQQAKTAILTSNHEGKTMNLSMNIGPIVALIAGILILLIPRLLNYIVAVYLIVIGLIGLFGTGSLRI